MHGQQNIKTLDKIQASLKSDKKNGHSTKRLTHIYNISLNSYYNGKWFRQTL